MGDEQRVDDAELATGQVIPFPARNSSPPPPLPRLPRAIPTPGAGAGSRGLFEAALTRRFDRHAA